ncbi:MAG TPA: UDP-N-acetylmuramoyl-tripeptide--D-alanyl-D-alanine ligase [Thermoleophilaceae bacterium]|nr:UDP-N-acetylmuramoyl-tripeptide--D-alanyl-D-alanine ligase [Thermoleophilaceae bacterium]
MIEKNAAWVARCAGATLLVGDPDVPGPRRAVVDSRHAGPGDLFVGLVGQSADGGEFAASALEAGAWGAMVGPRRARELGGRGLVIETHNTLKAMQRLARAWRRDLACPVIGVTGSTGKTSTKDILKALLAPRLKTHANRENWNTEIGLPLTLLEAEPGTQAIVLEMAMRGEGQIDELVQIAEPDVGVIVSVGPVHLELLGTVERVAAAKAELIAGLPAGATCIVPAGEPLLEPHLRSDLDTVTFGPGGDVTLASFERGRAEIDARGQRVVLELPYDEPYNLMNTLAAVGAAIAIGVTPEGAVQPEFSSLRGQVLELDGGVTIVNDCYNANPMSMRAALDHLAGSAAERRLAILGGMAELGPDSSAFHREIGEHAARLGIDVLITVGEEALAFGDGFDGELHSVATPEEAGALLEELAAPGDRVLVKGSRAVGLERVLA